MIAAVKLVLNSPLDTQTLSSLFHDKGDLFLVWPDAEYPFNHNQWKEVLNEARGHRSYFITYHDRIVGHCTLRRTEEAGVWSVSFMYLYPELRSRGIGKIVLGQLEEIARNELKAKALILRVRDYNPRALKAYVGAGFKETGREGTLIRMRKVLV